jgi:hypothetical protein
MLLIRTRRRWPEAAVEMDEATQAGARPPTTSGANAESFEEVFESYV